MLHDWEQIGCVKWSKQKSALCTLHRPDCDPIVMRLKISQFAVGSVQCASNFVPNLSTIQHLVLIVTQSGISNMFDICHGEGHCCIRVESGSGCVWLSLT